MSFNNFPYIHCRKFKNKQPYQTKLSQHFYDFIKNIYDKSISLLNGFIEQNNYIGGGESLFLFILLIHKFLLI